MQTFPVGLLQCNCSILGDEESGEAIIVDPGGDGPEIVRRVTERGLKVTQIVHTHAHIDHVGASAEVKAATGGAAWLHEGDQWLLDHLDVQAQMIGGGPPEAVVLDGFLTEGQRFDFAGSKVEVIHTPGHSPGSCCFTLAAEGRQLVFAGDVLFRGGIGRTDLWGGDTALMMESLQGKLMGFDDDTEVITGHGPATSIGVERRDNPFLSGDFRF